jgi:UDP-galactopyranose mutase
LDEYYDYDLGKLRYRGQKREHKHILNKSQYQPVGQVNYPSLEVPYVRILEWKHMMAEHEKSKIKGTVITTEIPFDADQPDKYEYPFPDYFNKKLYNRYSERAKREKKLLVCGRLGEYRYFDMDQAIGRAIMLAERILTNDVSAVKQLIGVET